MHTLETTEAAHDIGIDVLLDDVLPWLRDSGGFRGLVRLSTAERAKTIVITLWADEASMAQSSEAARRFGALVAETAGSTRVALEDLEVTYLDVELG